MILGQRFIRSKEMKKHLIAGTVIAVVFDIIFIVYAIGKSGQLIESKPLLIFNVVLCLPFGIIGYTIIQLVNGWLNSHFIVFGQNAVKGYIIDNFIVPLIGVAGGMFFGAEIIENIFGIGVVMNYLT
jgi:hypothetical protein